MGFYKFNHTITFKGNYSEFKAILDAILNETEKSKAWGMYYNKDEYSFYSKEKKRFGNTRIFYVGSEPAFYGRIRSLNENLHVLELNSKLRPAQQLIILTSVIFLVLFIGISLSWLGIAVFILFELAASIFFQINFNSEVDDILESFKFQIARQVKKI